jgi:periplasmic protein TonB
MFEDSTFESTGRIRTRSRGWMIATFLLNGSILLTLILIPLIYPEALQRQVPSFLLTAPPPPPTPPPVQQEPRPAFHGRSEIVGSHVLAPAVLPTTIGHWDGPERNAAPTLLSFDSSNGILDGATGVFRRRATVVHPDVAGPVRLSSVLVAGLALYKPAPPYPVIAREAGVQGTVMLQATISKNGTIENLRVVSGPALLQQAAIDAVKSWRYRPYLLNNLPVEVETTVNVVFTLGR